jgi:acyl-CoA synthetase (AMP-forming)/AMP-acid ligase II
MSAPAYTAPSPATLADLLQQPQFDSRCALVLPATAGPDRAARYSYAELRGVVQSLQRSLLASGLRPGDRVALSFPNGLEVVSTFLAVTLSRATAAPLNPAYTKEEVQFYLNDMKCSAILLPEGGAPVARAAAMELKVPIYDLRWTGRKSLQLVPGPQQGPGVTVTDAATLERASAATSPLPQPLPSDVALILHTSGTTSAPKGVPLTHANLCRTLHNINNTYRLQKDDVCLLVMPLFHVHGLMACLLSPFASGGTVVVPPKFSASTFWQDFAEQGCTWYSAVPTIHQILLAHEPSAPSTSQRSKLKFIRSCSSALAAATHRQLEDVFKVPVVEALAMTEGAHQIASNDLPPGKRKGGSVGRGQGVEVKILDDQGHELPTGKEGEICIKGPNVTAGYLNNPAANAASFHPTKSGRFFRTGDQGFLDSDNFLYVTGRLKELINRGGEKIAPLELDAVLLGAPNVSEAVAFAQPHAMLGQEVAAAIVPTKEAWAKLQAAGPAGAPKRIAAEQELRKHILAHASTKLAPFKLPKLIFFADVLPKTATGKIQRRNVAAHFLALPNQPLPAKL